MTFVIRDLLLRPQLYQQCREEVERATQGGPLLKEHLPSLTIIDACIHESAPPPVTLTSYLSHDSLSDIPLPPVL